MIREACDTGPAWAAVTTRRPKAELRPWKQPAQTPVGALVVPEPATDGPDRYARRQKAGRREVPQLVEANRQQKPTVSNFGEISGDPGAYRSTPAPHVVEGPHCDRVRTRMRAGTRASGRRAGN